MRCRGHTKDGKPCRAPEELVGDDGWCISHGPGADKRLSQAGRLGAAATARRWRGKGLDEGELGPLDSHADAQRWLRIAGEAVATNRISDRQANAISKAVAEWVKAESGRVKEVELAELHEMVAELKRGKLKAVP